MGIEIYKNCKNTTQPPAEIANIMQIFKNYSYTNNLYLNKVNKANTFICLKMHSPENSYWSNFKRKTGKKVSCDMFKKFTTSWSLFTAL